MPNVVVLIPARWGSKGIPNKNFRSLGGRSPVHRAAMCAYEAGLRDVVISTDHPTFEGIVTQEWGTRLLRVGAPLHTDDCAMIDVVKDALARMPGPDDQIILLLQPTQPLRQPKHLIAAMLLLEASKADSVVSVVALPTTHNPEWGLEVRGERLYGHTKAYGLSYLGQLPSRRQDFPVRYIRDGTCYCFRRFTVSRFGDIYGQDVRPLIIPASETCPLDTPEDWAEAERRLRERR